MPGGPDALPRVDPGACHFALTADRSPIDRWGIFAAEPIPGRRRVIEYTGQVIEGREVYRRRIRPHLYLFWIGRGRAIDGAVGGGGAEFINHGCEPNLVARVRGGRVGLVSLRRIERGEELLLDYRVTGDVGLLECRCGARSCRGFMNRPPHVRGQRSSRARNPVTPASTGGPHARTESPSRSRRVDRRGRGAARRHRRAGAP